MTHFVPHEMIASQSLNGICPMILMSRNPRARLISFLRSKYFIRYSEFHLTDLSGKFHCN